MRQFDIDDPAANLVDLLKEAVDRGETVALARDGLTIARVVPTQDVDPEERKKAFERFMKNRQPIKNLTWQELYSWRHETSSPCQD